MKKKIEREPRKWFGKETPIKAHTSQPARDKNRELNEKRKEYINIKIGGGGKYY